MFNISQAPLFQGSDKHSDIPGAHVTGFTELQEASKSNPSARNLTVVYKAPTSFREDVLPALSKGASNLARGLLAVPALFIAAPFMLASTVMALPLFGLNCADRLCHHLDNEAAHKSLRDESISYAAMSWIPKSLVAIIGGAFEAGSLAVGSLVSFVVIGKTDAESIRKVAQFVNLPSHYSFKEVMARATVYCKIGMLVHKENAGVAAKVCLIN